MRPETPEKREGASAPSHGIFYTRAGGFGPGAYALFSAITLAAMVLCVCVGSVNIPLRDTAAVVWAAVRRQPIPPVMARSIILSVRIPRVLCVALVGACLSLCGAAMQGLLKNPLADGSTMGVSSGASLGAIISIAFGITIPGLGFSGTTVMAIFFAFGSLLFILALTYRLDSSLSTNTIILIGIIFSMFVSSISNFIITMAGDHVKTITFWTLGSLQNSSYKSALLVFVPLVICGGILLSDADELNAFSVGEDNARNIGVNIRRVKLEVLVCISILIGVCVSLGGTIGFVGLVTPHILRGLLGPNHRRLLPACVFGGAVFLLLADLICRTVLAPRELPIGIVTSFVGAIVFVFIFYSQRRRTH